MHHILCIMYYMLYIMYHVSCIIYSGAEVLGFGLRYFNFTEYCKTGFQMTASVYVLKGPRFPCPTLNS